jgi:hypothetical protein
MYTKNLDYETKWGRKIFSFGEIKVGEKNNVFCIKKNSIFARSKIKADLLSTNREGEIFVCKRK